MIHCVFYSTNRGVPVASLPDALMQGQAGDRGLFLPESYPAISLEEIALWKGLGYPEIAFKVLRQFTSGVFDDAVLRAMCDDAYDYEVPLEHVTGRPCIRASDSEATGTPRLVL